MSDISYNEMSCFSVAVLGCVATGKTSIINRIINNSFVSIYEPSMDINYYNLLFSLSEENIKDKRYVMIRVEDQYVSIKYSFGLNNPLLQTPEEHIKSNVLKEKRKKMTEDFKQLMFTSTAKRKILSENMDMKKSTKKIVDNDKNK